MHPPSAPPRRSKIVPPETTSSGVPFAEPLLANSRKSSTDALRFPIRFNRAIGRPLNSLEPPRIPDPSPERSQWPTAPPPAPLHIWNLPPSPLAGSRGSQRAEVRAVPNGRRFARFPTGSSSRGSQRAEVRAVPNGRSSSRGSQRKGEDGEAPSRVYKGGMAEARATPPTLDE